MENREYGMEDMFNNGQDDVLLMHNDVTVYRLYLLSGLLYAACGVSSWCFSTNGELMQDAYPSYNDFLAFFRLSGCLDYMIAQAQKANGPMLLTDPLDMIWIADNVWTEDARNMIIVIGPMFDSTSPIQNLEDALRRLDISYAMRKMLLSKVERVPVLSQPNIIQFVRMLHYTIYGEKLDAGKIHHQVTEDLAGIRNTPVTQVSYESAERTYSAEKMILGVVRDGNLYGKKIVERAMTFLLRKDDGVQEPHRDAKNTMVIYAALFARAAVEGGLSVQIARTMEAQYIRAVERCGRTSDLTNLYNKMLRDFTAEVNHCKENPKISPAIQNCCAYILTNLREPLELADIAKAVGYTEYYLTKKFRKETGVRLVDYIKNARLEQAKLMLLTDMSIQDISDELQFSSRGYFSKVFKESVGMTPAEYHNSMGKGENDES